MLLPPPQVIELYLGAPCPAGPPTLSHQELRLPCVLLIALVQCSLKGVQVSVVQLIRRRSMQARHLSRLPVPLLLLRPHLQSSQRALESYHLRTRPTPLSAAFSAVCMHLRHLSWCIR